MTVPSYDALLLVSFGGPEGPDDVLPFLENVLRGRNVPRQRMEEVAKHYHHFGGVSPINQQNRLLIEALRHEFSQHDMHLPIYWGNRNWDPLLADTIGQMAQDGIRQALALVTSAFSCYSGCRQYRENIFEACQEVGPTAPRIDKIRVFYNQPGFVWAIADRVREAVSQLTSDQQQRAMLVFTAHSIPTTMAAGCSYESQLRESARLVAEAAGQSRWQLAYQSRSGPPTQPWLEPDICDALRQIKKDEPDAAVVVAPLGFICDHMEVLFDLDTEARDVADQLGLTMVRAGTAGVHPRFIEGLRELVQERLSGATPQALGAHGPYPHSCPIGCCPSGRPGGVSCVP